MMILKAMARLGVCAAAIVVAASAGMLAQTAPATTLRLEMTAAGRVADIAAFRKDFLAKDMSYSPAARLEAEQRLATLEAQVARVSQAYFDLELARIVALADNGHTHYVLGSIGRYYNRAPVRLAAFGEDFHVLRASEANADLLGAKLTSIDGHSIDELRRAGRELWGGEKAFRDRFSFNLLESPDLLNALGLAAAAHEAVYAFATRSGATIERRLEGVAPDAMRPFAPPLRTLYPQKLPLEDGGWRTALASIEAPWALQDADEPFRWRSAPEMKAIVIQLRQNHDSDGHRISKALSAFTAAIKSEKPSNIVLDMRFNGGGDLNTTRDFMQSLPKLVAGRIFVLTSPLTFSAAISSVGYLEQAAPERVGIIGEPTGDRLMFFAEGRGMNLPNSKGFIGFATERHDYANGCRDFKDCHRSVVRHPIAVKSLAPDIAAPWTIEDYLAGRDPGIEAVAQVLAKT